MKEIWLKRKMGSWRKKNRKMTTKVIFGIKKLLVFGKKLKKKKMCLIESQYGGGEGGVDERIEEKKKNWRGFGFSDEIKWNQKQQHFN